MARQPQHNLRESEVNSHWGGTCLPVLPALGRRSVSSCAIPLTAGQCLSGGHLEVAGHEDGHDGQAAEAHPQGAGVQLV